jgi:hypothetical protein
MKNLRSKSGQDGMDWNCAEFNLEKLFSSLLHKYEK